MTIYDIQVQNTPVKNTKNGHQDQTLHGQDRGQLQDKMLQMYKNKTINVIFI